MKYLLSVLLLLVFLVAGCDSATELITGPAIEYDKAFIKSLTITALPFSTPSGGGWDVFAGGPDVYWELQNLQGKRRRLYVD